MTETETRGAWRAIVGGVASGEWGVGVDGSGWVTVYVGGGFVGVVVGCVDAWLRGRGGAGAPRLSLRWEVVCGGGRVVVAWCVVCSA